MPAIKLLAPSVFAKLPSEDPLPRDHDGLIAHLMGRYEYSPMNERTLHAVGKDVDYIFHRLNRLRGFTMTWKVGVNQELPEHSDRSTSLPIDFHPEILGNRSTECRNLGGNYEFRDQRTGLTTVDASYWVGLDRHAYTIDLYLKSQERRT